MKDKDANIVIKFIALIFILFWGNKLIQSLILFFGGANSKNEDENNKHELEDLDDLIKEQYLSHPTNQYYTYASAIQVALQAGWTEDEEAVYEILKKLWNNSDYLMLKKAWGLRPIGFYGFRVSMPLEKAIRFYFNNDEVGKCNYILANQTGHFITYRI